MNLTFLNQITKFIISAEPLPPRKLSAGSTSSQSSAGNGSARDSGIPIAVLGLDVDERYKDKR